MNTIESWDEDKENEIEACLRHLDSSRAISNEYVPLEELNGNTQIDKP